MTENELTKEAFQYIVARIAERGLEAVKEYRESKDDFQSGRSMAYYEVLDIIRSELLVREQNLEDSLNIDIENTFM